MRSRWNVGGVWALVCVAGCSTGNDNNQGMNGLLGGAGITASGAGSSAPPLTGGGAGAPATSATGGKGAVGTATGGGPAAATAGTGSGTAGMIAATGGMTGGAGMSTSGAGTGTAGTSTAGSGTAGAAGMSAPATKSPCISAAKQVIFIGDSYSNYDIAHTSLNILMSMRAQMGGALMAGQTYPNYAVAGTTFSAPPAGIPPQWDQVKSQKPIHLVIMDGGGNDVLISNRQCLADGSEKDAGCQQVVQATLDEAKTILADMKSSGVSDVIWFWYPHIPDMLGGNGNSISDYAYQKLVPIAQAASSDNFHVYMVDTVPLFMGHPEYFFTDGIHANDSGEGKIADAIWMVMKDHCIGQAASSGCCVAM